MPAASRLLRRRRSLPKHSAHRNVSGEKGSRAVLSLSEFDASRSAWPFLLRAVIEARFRAAMPRDKLLKQCEEQLSGVSILG